MAGVNPVLLAAFVLVSLLSMGSIMAQLAEETCEGACLQKYTETITAFANQPGPIQEAATAYQQCIAGC